MCNPTCPDFDLSSVVDLVENSDESGSGATLTPEDRNPLLQQCPRLVVHRDLLLNSSPFFRNAFADGSWKESTERTCALDTSTAVLQVFAHWLYYGKIVEPCPCNTLVYANIFAATYLIDRLATDSLALMRSSSARNFWFPSTQIVKDVYANTEEASPLRECIVVALAQSSSSDKQFIIRDAPEAFVRDLASYLSFDSGDRPDHRDWSFWHGSSHVPERRIRFEDTTTFHLQDASDPAVIHSDVLYRTDSPSLGSRHLESRQGHVHSSRTISASTFKIFALWLYFKEDLNSPGHACQTRLSLRQLLDCYNAALVLSACQVQGPDAEGQQESAEDGHLGKALRAYGARFGGCVLAAIETYCHAREEAPSSEEVGVAYTITSSDDPLRKLFGQIFIAKGRRSITETTHSEFQGELNASLLDRIKDLEDYVNQVQAVLQPHKAMREGRKTKASLTTRKTSYHIDVGAQDLDRLLHIEVPKTR